MAKFGIGRLAKDTDPTNEERAAKERQEITADMVAGEADFAPAGTTPGQEAEGEVCARCGRPAAGWNPGASEYLCRRHWDQY